jgi:type IV secretory pathway VirB10-like protein
VAKAPGRKLKVFQAQFGFYDTVVAAPSQAAALRAWGTHQNLFASGEATLTTDEAAIGAAIAHPETPLRRAVGSTDAFALEPTSLPKVPNAPKTAATKPAVKPKPAAPPRPAADRSKLDSAEKALGQLDDRRKREEAAFRQEEDELEARRTAAQEAYVEARKAATAKVVDARTDYRKAGGAD